MVPAVITLLPPQSNSTGVQSQTNTQHIAEGLKQDKFITSDPAVFAKKLQEVDNNFEVLIVLKDASVPGLARMQKGSSPRCPNVDYIEANESHPVYFDTSPVNMLL